MKSVRLSHLAESGFDDERVVSSLSAMAKLHARASVSTNEDVNASLLVLDSGCGCATVVLDGHVILAPFNIASPPNGGDLFAHGFRKRALLSSLIPMGGASEICELLFNSY
jgi:hypothetical protein